MLERRFHLRVRLRIDVEDEVEEIVDVSDLARAQRLIARSKMAPSAPRRRPSPDRSEEEEDEEEEEIASEGGRLLGGGGGSPR
jgi:hypothetical protein